jgi:hypothetical protein
MNPKKYQPIEDSANAWTLEIIPLLVINVPNIHRTNVNKMRTTFQTFSIPFFSWIITEWRKAIPVSQGIREAFSTGSHDQYPPQPSST